MTLIEVDGAAGGASEAGGVGGTDVEVKQLLSNGPGERTVVVTLPTPGSAVQPFHNPTPS